MTSSKDVLSALLRDRLQKGDSLAAKQRRLLEKVGLTKRVLDELEMQYQQRMTDDAAARLLELRKDDR